MLYILPRVVLQVKASLYYKTINNKNKKTYFILPRGGCLFLRGVCSSLRVGVGGWLRAPPRPARSRGRAAALLFIGALSSRREGDSFFFLVWLAP